MSVTRAMLKEAGVTEDAKIDEIMDAYSRAIGSAKAQGESDLKSENDSLRNQLQEVNQTIEELKNNETTAQEAKDTIAQLQAQLADKDKEHEAQRLADKQTFAVQLALKDTDTVDSDILFSLIDMDKVQFDEDGKPQLDDTIKSLKENKPYLFQKQTEEEPDDKAPSIVVGGNPSANGESKEDPFEAAMNMYK
ncbi:scaffolding protein [Atopobacter sp. AH10]|uniref:phage scaffolding protein n=1 Tax=Atopobacter sp. AH10 TaxID=2315861 RepID=UPI000EF1DD7C|nr:phage scaffolding protein [Atopobacter sp. AH10]RLK63159.1 scaffolding protein [Atopobacter sp. AH10]